MKTPLARLWIGASIMLLAMLLVIMTFFINVGDPLVLAWSIACAGEFTGDLCSEY